MTIPFQTGAAAFVHRGLPSFMRGRLHSASRGGSDGYEEAGYTLGRHLEREIPDNADVHEWEDVLAFVDAFLDDDERLIAWLVTTYPRILAGVPANRRSKFAAGVRRGRYVDRQR